MTPSADAVARAKEVYAHVIRYPAALLADHEGETSWVQAIAAALAEAAEGARAQAVEACAKAIPTTWLDPLLSGPERVAQFLSVPDVERLLRALAERIRALAPADTPADGAAGRDNGER